MMAIDWTRWGPIGALAGAGLVLIMSAFESQPEPAPVKPRRSPKRRTIVEDFDDDEVERDEKPSDNRRSSARDDRRADSGEPTSQRSEPEPDPEPRDPEQGSADGAEGESGVSGSGSDGSAGGEN